MEDLGRLKRIKEQYILTNGIFNCVEPKVKVDIQKGRYPYTQQALFYSIKKIDIILKSFLNQLSPEFYYVNNILVRALFEHYLVSYFISAKAEFESTDQVGREFYSEYLMSEHIKRVSYDISIDDIINKVPKRDVFEEFKRVQTDYQHMTVPQKDEFHRTANQFVDIKGIIRYLLHYDNQKETSKTFHEVLPILLKVYNHVSSYVHGGAAAEAETFEWLSDETKKERINSYLHYCMIISYAAKQRLLTMLMNVNPEYSEIMKPIEMFLLNRYFVNFDPKL